MATPTSHNLVAAANAVGTWAPSLVATDITVTNEGTADVFLTVDGSTPTLNGDNEYYIPVGGYEEIPQISTAGPGNPSGAPATLTVKAISAAALTIWIEVNN